MFIAEDRQEVPEFVPEFGIAPGARSPAVDQWIPDASDGNPVCARLTTLLDMLKQYAFGFGEVLIRLEKLRNRAELWVASASSARLKVDQHEREEMSKCLVEMGAECSSLGLFSSSDLISHIESELRRKDEDYTYGDLTNHLNSFNYSFFNDLRKNFFFRIDDNKKQYFQKDDLFGPDVKGAFKSCAGEIQSAGSCFSLEQYDACVFHLMRTLERGLGVLAVKFSVPFQYENWHNVIEKIEVEIRGMDKRFGQDWKEQQKFCSQAASQFMFLKDAWRNHAMHGRDVYNEGLALSIFSNVRGLMQALAKGGFHD